MNDIPEPDRNDLKAADFGSGFAWGVATAAYQIEGAYDKEDKGASIWDEFTSRRGTISNGEDGKIACDFYHRYKEDILLLKSMNVPNFRFSISWSRVLPDGHGKLSRSGIDFYDRVIDFCLECGITPWITLYHWDLPQALEAKGGWVSRDVLNWFEEFARLCASSFGDRVKHWMVLNEPMVFTGAGYFLGIHAPGKKGLKNFLPAVHHAVMCQALGGKVIRELVKDAVVGTTISCSQITPYSDNAKDKRAAHRADALLNRMFIEPILGMGYPIESLPVLKRLERYRKAEDDADMIFDFDFIGVQNYTREVVRHSYLVPHIRAKIVKASKRAVKTTVMDWEVHPPALYNMIKKFDGYSGVKKIIITENGAAFKDEMLKGRVKDKERLCYLRDHVRQVYKAKKEGLSVSGYFIWTLMDNFEWAEGYKPRFGLVYTDFTSQKRIVKSSGRWYRDFLK